MTDRFKALGAYRAWQTLARMVGPMIGFAFLGLPAGVGPDAALAVKLFNFYTVPAWIATGLGLFATIFTLRYFSEAASHSPTLASCEQQPQERQPFSLATRSLALPIGTSLAINLVWGAAFWSVNAQLFGFGAATFRVINSQNDIWKPFTGLGVGSIGGVWLWKKLSKHLGTPSGIEKKWASLGLLFGVASFALFINYDGGSAVPDEWRLYMGTAMLGASATWWNANNIVIYSKVLTWKQAELGNSIGLVMALFAMAGAGGRALGPLISGLVMKVVVHGAQSMNCDEMVQPPGKGDCIVAANSSLLSGGRDVSTAAQLCCISYDSYCVDGCELSNANSFLPALMGIGATMFIVNRFYALRLSGYEAYEAEEQDAQGAAASALLHADAVR